MRTIARSLAAVCLALAPVHAQNTNRTPAAPPAPAHNTMILTGCLTVGTDPTTYKLTNVLPAGQAAQPQPRSVGTSGERIEYELIAETRLDRASVSAVDLKKFLGRRVEITARPLEDVPASPATKAGGEAKSDLGAAKPAEPKIEKVTVTAVEQVSASCQ